MASQKVGLSINHISIPITEFVQLFVNNIVTGMLSSLKGIDDIHSVNLLIDGDNVDICINDAAVPSNDFVNGFLKNTVTGMLTSLKDVDRIDRLEIKIAE